MLKKNVASYITRLKTLDLHCLKIKTMELKAAVTVVTETTSYAVNLAIK